MILIPYAKAALRFLLLSGGWIAGLSFFSLATGLLVGLFLAGCAWGCSSTLRALP